VNSKVLTSDYNTKSVQSKELAKEIGRYKRQHKRLSEVIKRAQKYQTVQESQPDQLLIV